MFPWKNQVIVRKENCENLLILTLSNLKTPFLQEASFAFKLQPQLCALEV